MGCKIEEIEGIGPAYRDKLGQAAIHTTDDLLHQCCGPKGRAEVAAKTGCSEAQLLKWANMADLMRITGIGPEFAELLEAAGVDTVKELRTRRSDNLSAKMAEVNETAKLTRRVPSEDQVSGWIQQAGTLEATIDH